MPFYMKNHNLVNLKNRQLIKMHEMFVNMIKFVVVVQIRSSLYLARSEFLRFVMDISKNCSTLLKLVQMTELRLHFFIIMFHTFVYHLIILLCLSFTVVNKTFCHRSKCNRKLFMIAIKNISTFICFYEYNEINSFVKETVL